MDINHKNIRISIINDEFLNTSPFAPIDLIYTDPPYGRKYENSYASLAKYAYNNLTINGILLSYQGHSNFHNILIKMDKWLYYRHTLMLSYKTGVPNGGNRNIDSGRPITIHTKSSNTLIHTMPDLLIKSKDHDNELHVWQQNLSSAELYIKQFSNEGDVVCDPFLGSGTFAIASIKNNRSFIGIERYKATYDIAVNRIQEYINGIS